MDGTYQDIHVLDKHGETHVKRACQIKNIRFDSSFYPHIEITIIEGGEKRKLYLPMTDGMKLLID